SAEQTTGLAPLQTPASQVSLCVQALPSVQAVPLAFSGLEQVPFAGSQVPASWHWSSAEQTTGLAPVQTPASQVSLCVQALPSVQVVPLAFSGLEQVPFAGSQLPACCHWSSAEQTARLALLSLPTRQASHCVQALPSVQVTPSALLGFEQVPVAGSQVPASWH